MYSICILTIRDSSNTYLFFAGWLPEFSEQFSIVDFPDEYRSVLVQVSAYLGFATF